MEILMETKDWLIAVKPVGMLSEQTEQGDGFADLLAAENGGYIGVIHRLDRGVGGVMLYAKTPTSAAWLSQAAQEHRLKKEYVAIVEGIPTATEGELWDLLYYDRSKNKVFPVKRERRGVKEARLSYRVLQTVSHPETGKPITLVSVTPHTGRTHQIRVQFASRGLPLLGDRRYGGSGSTEIALWCRSITIPAKKNESEQTVCHDPTGAPWDWLLPVD